MRKKVFASENIDVFYVEGKPSNPVVVTFDALIDEPVADRKGFAEDYLNQKGISAYHFIHKKNAWYHFPEMREALALVRKNIPVDTPVITYGSSMGGYAAYRFSGALNAQKVIAFSPQYSMKQEVVPWEKRWKHHRSQLSHCMEHLAVNPLTETYLFYDPLIDDRRHAEMIAPLSQTYHIRMKYSGHYSIFMLKQIGLLDDTLIRIIEGRLDIEKLQHDIAINSEKSAHFLANKAMNLPYIAKRQRLELFRKAVSCDKKEIEFQLHLAKALASYGQLQEAQHIYRNVWIDNPENNLGLLSYMGYLNLCGDYDNSWIVFNQLAEAAPHIVLAANLKNTNYRHFPIRNDQIVKRVLRSIFGFLL